MAIGILCMTNISVSFAADLIVEKRLITPKTLPKNAIRVPFLEVKLWAQGGAVNVKSFTIQRTGLSTNEDFGRVWAEADNFLRSRSRNINNDDLVETSFYRPLHIPNGSSATVTIYANLEFDSGGGRTAAFNLVGLETDADNTQFEDTRSMSQILAKKPIAVTQSQNTNSRYDRTRFRIKCTYGRCKLVPRN